MGEKGSVVSRNSMNDCAGTETVRGGEAWRQGLPGAEAGNRAGFWRRDLSGAHPPGCRWVVPFHRVFTHLLPVARVRGGPGFAARVLVRRVFTGRVFVDGQEPDSLPQRDDTGEFEVSTLVEQVGTLNGQGGGEVTATG